MQEIEINILQTTILILDGVSDSDLLFKHGLGKYMKQAKEIVKIIKEK